MINYNAERLRGEKHKEKGTLLTLSLFIVSLLLQGSGFSDTCQPRFYITERSNIMTMEEGRSGLLICVGVFIGIILLIAFLCHLHTVIFKRGPTCEGCRYLWSFANEQCSGHCCMHPENDKKAPSGCWMNACSCNRNNDCKLRKQVPIWMIWRG